MFENPRIGEGKGKDASDAGSALKHLNKNDNFMRRG